jgi:myo-inositol-1(or 4)-monophosphatase
MAGSPLINVMVAAARKAGRSLNRDFGEVENLQVSIKGPGDFVTAADHRAEDILYNELSKAREGYGFLMEERGEIEGKDKSHRWIIDPLDGTTNFLHSIPLFAISIGLEREGELVAGVVYNPVLDEIYTAEKGKGAFYNDRRRLRVAGRRDLSDCVVATGIPHRGRPQHEVFRKELRVMMENTAGIRRTGSAAIDLAWIAAGRFDAFWERNLKAWDMAAGIVLVREASGVASDLNGADDMFATGGIIATNSQIHRRLVPILKDAASS